MSVRAQIRSTLVNVDKRLGVREWLRQDRDYVEAKPVDVFTSTAEIFHPEPRTVLDIGANTGQFAEEAFRAFPGVTIYSFEPISECYEQLVQMSQRQPTLHPIELALSDRDGEAEFWLSHYRGSSSFQKVLPMHLDVWPFTEIEDNVTMRVARLDSMASELDLTPPVFAKLDVQGHELSVINGGRETLSKCQRIMVECNFAPLYEGQPTFDQLYDSLHSLGFLFDGFIGHLRDPRNFELLAADAIFYQNQEQQI